jgi:hypothetical protein
MGMISIINTTPYKEQPVPEVDKEYHIFDDGKIKPSRHYMAKVVEVIPFEDMDLDSDLIDVWTVEKEECNFLYAQETDYFIRAESDFDENPLYFVRTVYGGWFSIDYPNYLMSARLDIDGSLYRDMVEFYGE